MDEKHVVLTQWNSMQPSKEGKSVLCDTMDETGGCYVMRRESGAERPMLRHFTYRM